MYGGYNNDGFNRIAGIGKRSPDAAKRNPG